MIDTRDFKKYFQHLKSLTFANFVREMNVLHTLAYAAADRQYQEALEIEDNPALKARVIDRVALIRKVEGMNVITVENTRAELLAKNEVVEEIRELKRINAELEAEIKRLKGVQ